jgi:glucose-1-phosphate cytidylyltransferase
MDGDQIVEFSEKPQTAEGWINGAFFVCEPGIFDYIDGDLTHFEKEPLERLARDGQLMAYRHSSFWQCMDTIREKKLLEGLWDSGNAPWKIWEDSNAGISNRTRGLYRHGAGAFAAEGRTRANGAGQ